MTDANNNPEIVVNTNPDSTGDGDLDFNPPDDWGAKLLESLGVDPAADLDPAGTDYGDAVGIDLSKRDPTDADETTDVTEAAVKDATDGDETPTQDAPASSESSSVSPETATSETPTTDEAAPAPESTEQSQPQEQITGGWDYQYLDPSTNQPATVHFDDSQISRALQIANWADTLPDELRQQFADVESGTHITVPRTEYDEYVAFKQSSSKQQRDADLDNLDADPQVVELLRKQRDEIEQLKGNSDQYQADAPRGYANQYANYSATTTAFDQAASAYQAARALTPEEMNRLYSTTVNSGIVSHLAASKAQYSPTGNVVSPANPAEVLYEALDYHLSRDPALHSAVIQRLNTPASQQPADTSHIPPAAEHSDAAITTKKARASSMSAAPSAAVNPAPRNVAELSDPELVAEIEAFLTPVMRET